MTGSKISNGAPLAAGWASSTIDLPTVFFGRQPSSLWRNIILWFSVGVNGAGVDEIPKVGEAAMATQMLHPISTKSKSTMNKILVLPFAMKTNMTLHLEFNRPPEDVVEAATLEVVWVMEDVGAGATFDSWP
jgi:hypothetical protein